MPRLAAPSKNCTVPVGTPVPGAIGATVAVSVTDCPKTDGLGDEERAVVVFDWPTTCDTAFVVLVIKLGLPEYTPVMVCVPPWPGPRT